MSFKLLFSRSCDASELVGSTISWNVTVLKILDKRDTEAYRKKFQAVTTKDLTAA